MNAQKVYFMEANKINWTIELNLPYLTLFFFFLSPPPPAICEFEEQKFSCNLGWLFSNTVGLELTDSYEGKLIKS